MYVSLWWSPEGDVFGSTMFLHEDISHGLVSYVDPGDILSAANGFSKVKKQHDKNMTQQ